MRLMEKDFELLIAFLIREAYEFTSITTKDSAADYCTAIVDQMEAELSNYDGADYVHIESLSNMGLMYRRLTLTPQEWKTGIELTFFLPPAPPPRGRVSVSVKREGKKK